MTDFHGYTNGDTWLVASTADNSPFLYERLTAAFDHDEVYKVIVDYPFDEKDFDVNDVDLQEIYERYSRYYDPEA